MTEAARAFAPLTSDDLKSTALVPPMPDNGALNVVPVPDDAPQPEAHPTLGVASAKWEYRAANGALLGLAFRWDTPKPGDPYHKDIRYQTYGQGNGWQWKHWPTPRPLYGLDRLAQRPNAPVLVCEGEKSADAASVLFPGHVCITSSGGSNAAGKADWVPLKGRSVTIWPDADGPGQIYASDVARLALEAGAASVTVVNVPEAWPKGWDLADDLPEGLVLEDLAQMVRMALAVTTVSGTAWPEPEPLPALPAVAQFDLDLLPDSLRPLIEDIAERVQCPPDYPAVAAMVALGAVVGRKIGIRPKQQDDWLELPNLWGCIIGRPGVMKSPALAEAMKPLRRLEASALATHEADYAAWESRQEIVEMERKVAKERMLKALRKGDAVGTIGGTEDEPEPQAKRYIVNDSSIEAMGEILRANTNGVLAYRDELVSLLKSLDKEGNEGARGFYLTAWSGKEGYTFDRIGRGLNLRIDACCLSLLGSTQPAAIVSYLADAVATGGGDGLLSRFGMLVWPDVAGSWRNIDRWPDNEAKNRAVAAFERLNNLDGSVIGKVDTDGGPPFLRLDDRAQVVFNEWREDFEVRLRSGEYHPALESHLSKYRKLVPALALLLHLADDAGAAISEVSVLKALGWVEYLETHAHRAYAAVTGGDATAARALWRRIQSGDVADGFTEREIYRNEWSGLSRLEVAKAVTTLEEYGYLRSETLSLGNASGRSKTRWHINPRGLG